MNYKIIFHPLAVKELNDLDGRVKLLVIKQITKISKNPNYGENLGNKHGYDLTGYKKIYVDNKKIRIIYKVENEQVLIKIIAIGKREGLEVYKDVNKRIE